MASYCNRHTPAVPGRQRPDALSRADAFLIKCDRAGMERLLPAIRTRLARFKRPVFSFTLRPVGLEPIGTRNSPPETLRRKPYALTAGVGNPIQVRETVTAFLGHAPEAEFFFPDHHAYGFRDVERITQAGLPVICTRKDAVKLRELSAADVWALRVEACFGPSVWAGTSFPRWFDEWWRLRQENSIEQLGPRDSRWTGFAADADLWDETPPPPPRAAGNDPAAASGPADSAAPAEDPTAPPDRPDRADATDATEPANTTPPETGPDAEHVPAPDADNDPATMSRTFSCASDISPDTGEPRGASGE